MGNQIATENKMTTFERELKELINTRCLDNESHTPDFILADYLTMCLANFRDTVRKRDEWRGQDQEKEKTGE